MSELPSPQQITDVWYHANCADGFAAATAAWMVLGDNANYRDVRHGDPPPEVSSHSKLAIVDFAYPREQLVEIESRVAGLVVLDHHKSAAADLAGLDFARFEMSKSGCRMAWEFWHPDKPFPLTFAYVEDRDLWNWALPESREVSLALSQEPMEFVRWSRLDCEELKVTGRNLLNFQNNLVARAVSKAHWIELGGYRVPACNSCLYQSEIGDELCLKFPDAPFAAVYFNKGGAIAWSLRSIGEFDVSKVAGSFGGGGHRNAAGFAAKVDSPITSEPVLPHSL